MTEIDHGHVDVPLARPPESRRWHQTGREDGQCRLRPRQHCPPAPGETHADRRMRPPYLGSIRRGGAVEPGPRGIRGVDQQHRTPSGLRGVRQDCRGHTRAATWRRGQHRDHHAERGPVDATVNIDPRVLPRYRVGSAHRGPGDIASTRRPPGTG
ncbi:hypothetical protein [Amycolatopsis sp. H20-H5]|uniref:hypothetical protein n=1 Tax=Amycolatopsis sp. H20-H5 TaxID=3046309 RepID=UPI002DBEB35C|nr:hypothetical protein [Amycolatopsis sp. H20-H5]MEC3981989.1 hypothetical protein [Amycolatopsis sp. H20-H5]